MTMHVCCTPFGCYAKATSLVIIVVIAKLMIEKVMNSIVLSFEKLR